MTGNMNSLAALRNNPLLPTPAYAAKQLHSVPHFEVIDRGQFILDFCRDKWVLDIGASGPMHASIKQVAKKYQGLDRFPGDGIVGMDLDDVSLELPKYWGIERIVCGEVLEHLANPGYFLKRLRENYNASVVFTVPNAFSDSGRSWLERGIENVNSDHVAWYSYRTLRTLLGRYGYSARQWYWYKGRPNYSEGLIAVCHSH